MQLILNKVLRKSLASFQHVKKLSKEGNEKARKIYDYLKIYFEKFDLS